MKNLARILVIIVLGALLPAISLATPMFITDKVTVNILATPSPTSEVIAQMSTGDKIEMLRSEGDYSEIKTADDKIGWLLMQYLSDEEPMQKVFSQLVAKHRTVKNELKTAQIKIQKMNKLGKQVGNFKKTSKELKISQTMIKQLQETLDKKNIELTRMRGRLSQLPQGRGKIRPVSLAGETSIGTRIQTLPLSMLFITLGITLLLGTFIGYHWLDHKIRKRHGGIRFY